MDEQTITKYDRIRGDMNMLAANRDLALFTKPSTIQVVQTFTGRAETFVVATCRHAENGDYIFLECVDECNIVTRLCLPPRVANAIAGQRESLNKRRRSIAGKRRAEAMTDEQKQAASERLKKARRARKHK